MWLEQNECGKEGGFIRCQWGNQQFRRIFQTTAWNFVCILYEMYNISEFGTEKYCDLLWFFFFNSVHYFLIILTSVGVL